MIQCRRNYRRKRQFGITWVLAAALMAVLGASSANQVRADTLLYSFSGTAISADDTATVTGSFSVDVSAIADGLITGPEIMGLTFTVTSGGIDQPPVITFFSNSPSVVVDTGLDVNPITGDFVGGLSQDYLAGDSISPSGFGLFVDAHMNLAQEWADGSGGLPIGGEGAIFDGFGDWTITRITSAVPEPAAIQLLLLGSAGLGALRRIRRSPR